MDLVVKLVCIRKVNGMTLAPLEFVNVEVLTVSVGGGDMYIVSGVAIVNFSANDDDFVRDDVVFLLPKEASTSPTDPPLVIKDFADSVVSVFPAAAQSTGGDIVGWAVDTADTIAIGDNVQLTARLAVRGYNTTLFRIGFQVNVLTT
jgi:hypothetical protein